MLFALTTLVTSYAPRVKPTDSCQTYFGSACSAAIGNWLPEFGFGFGPAQRGIALGASATMVLRRYGKTDFNAVAGHPSLRELSYFHSFNSTCGEYDNFVLSDKKVIYIQLLEGC